MESNEFFNISFPDPSVIHFQKEKQNKDMYTWEQALSRRSPDLSLTVLFNVSLPNSSIFHFPKEEEEKEKKKAPVPHIQENKPRLHL